MSTIDEGVFKTLLDIALNKSDDISVRVVAIDKLADYLRYSWVRDRLRHLAANTKEPADVRSAAIRALG